MTCCVVAVAIPAIAPVVAGANGGPPTDAENKRALGKGAERMANGLYRVRHTDGSVVYSHGHDVAPDPANHGTSLGAGDPESNPTCVNWDQPQAVVLYGRPASAPDRYWEVKASLQTYVRQMDAALNEEALASGGVQAHYKVKCEGGGAPWVGSFVNSAGTDDFTSVVNAAKAAGYSTDNTRYVIFYDSDFACGVGHVMGDDRPTADNLNNGKERYGVTWRKCWGPHTAMHENGHNMGAVQPAAPASTGSGWHCNDEIDVMCYTDGGDKNQTMVTVCSDREHFDCGNDSYFDTAPEPGEWLATHWNIGSRLNKFLAFGADVNGTVSYSGVQRGKFEWHAYGDYVLVSDTYADGHSAKVTITRHGTQTYTCTDSDGANNGWKKCDWDMPEAQGIWLDIGMWSGANGVYQALSGHYFGRT